MRKWLFTTCGAIAFTVEPASTAAAQTLESLPPRARIRVWASSPSLAASVGEVVIVGPDTLVLQLRAPLVQHRIPRAALQRVQIARGKNRVRGGLVGATVGFLAGYAVAMVVDSPECPCWPGTEQIPESPRFVVAGTVVGAVLGARYFPPDGWVTLSFPPAPEDDER